jgi:hypothetical protein
LGCTIRNRRNTAERPLSVCAQGEFSERIPFPALRHTPVRGRSCVHECISGHLHIQAAYGERQVPEKQLVRVRAPSVCTAFRPWAEPLTPPRVRRTNDRATRAKNQAPLDMSGQGILPHRGGYSHQGRTDGKNDTWSAKPNRRTVKGSNPGDCDASPTGSWNRICRYCTPPRTAR